MKLLILVEYIYPDTIMGTIRWNKLVKYLKRIDGNCEIDVLSMNQTCCYGSRCSSYINKIYYFDNLYIFESPRLIRLRNRCSFLSKRARNFRMQKNHYSLLNKIRSSVLSNVEKKIYSSALDLVEMLNLKHYDIVISSYGSSPWPLVIGSRIKATNPSLLWVADFRDQWLRDHDSAVNKKKKTNYAKTHTKHVDIFFRIHDRLDLIETWGKPVLTIPNGFDPEDRQEIQTADRFIIAYTGTLYRTDDLQPFFQVLKDLRQSGEVDFRNVSLLYAGKTSGLFGEEVRQAGLEEIYTDLGLVDRNESLQLQAKSSILLMAGWTSESDVVEWSGKMYEYMMAARPVVYMMNTTIPWTLPARDMHRLGGVCYESCRHEETLPELREYVRKMYRMWKETGQVRVEQDQSYIDQYRYDVIAGQVYDVLRRELDRRKS